MKKIRFIPILILSVLILKTGLLAQSQSQFPEVEQFRLFTDRSLYIAGENIAFSAIQIPNPKLGIQLSSILYAELVSPQSEQMSQAKFLMDQTGAFGSLPIPDDVVSGNYFLRVYTKYMRNIGPEAYTYLALKIINPEQASTSYSIDSSLLLPLSPIPELKGNKISISTDQTQYGRNAKAILSLDFNQNSQDYIKASVSVIPEFALYGEQLEGSGKRAFQQLNYPPEMKGLSISGLLKNQQNDSVIPNSSITLSIIGEGRDFMATMTDSAGKYLFALPNYQGRRDLFLCNENQADSETKLLIDNDFCRIPVQLPDTVFQLTEAEKAVVLNMAVNKQLKDNFVTYSASPKKYNSRFNTYFYGTPTEIVRIGNYVELPNLEEYFNELPTLVKVRKRMGKKYFKVLSNNAEIPLFDPLILIDGVAIDNAEAVLALSPQQLDRIEIINTPYIKGAFTYGGIIHLISSEGYFANIDLPENGLFLDFQFLSANHFKLDQETDSAEFPDARNTLYWNPDITPTANNQELEFQTPSTPGRYKAIIRAVTHQGEYVSGSFVFEVR
ncbi:MAG: hypothetical protein KJ578_05950 [Bacteroidetes bacterium]|nr:hypothetical protein [Bacteroidota bacterium]MBU1578203.1 hypothetical protein [Bacteroidota bacterium]MBU2557304.1 hypothetical protein [Bacteroidota bacterium]